MKRILGVLVVFAFVVVAVEVYAETKAAPTNAPVAPAVVNNEVKKDTKTLATESCTKKNLVGTALDECVKNELASAKPEAPKTK